MSDATIEATPAKGLFARALGMFTAPKATFQSVVAHPKPAGILFLSIVLIAGTTVLPQFTATGKQLVLDTQVKAAERAAEARGQTLTEDQIARFDSFASFTPYITLAGILIFVPIVTMIFAGLYWLLFNVILGGTATFRQVLAVVAHPAIIGAAGTVIGTPIMYAQGKLSNVGPFNLGALAAGADPTSFFAHFMGAISIFQIWSLLVTAIGLAVLYRRKTGGIAATLMFIYLGITACMAYFFGGYMA